jgi:O-antigen/teichoic acid export membrane protein
MANLFQQLSHSLPKNERSNKVLVNIFLLFFLKGWSGVIQFILVPLTLLCLDKYEYGIWLLVNSILVWIDAFDIGLGNGLRNKIAEFVAKDKWDDARRAVSTTFGMLVMIVIPIAIVLFALIEFLDLYELLNVDVQRIHDLDGIIQTTIGLICGTFILKFIGNVYLGLQRPAISTLLVVGGQTLSMLIIAVLPYLFTHVSLFHVAVSYTATPLVIYLIAYPITFYKVYPKLKPSFILFQKKMIPELVGLGIKFFVLQLSGLILFTTSNLLISNLFGPNEVTPYQIVYKYFSFILMLVSIVITPIWSATTDAYVRGDYIWIKSLTKRMLKVLCLFTLLVILLGVISPWVYPYWTLGKVDIPIPMTILMGIYIIVVIFSLYFANILYGTGKIFVQMIVTLSEAIMFIPLAIYCGKIMGINGIIIALILSNIPCAITNTIQYYKIINQRATGVWNR